MKLSPQNELVSELQVAIQQHHCELFFHPAASGSVSSSYVIHMLISLPAAKAMRIKISCEVKLNVLSVELLHLLGLIRQQSKLNTLKPP